MPLFPKESDDVFDFIGQTVTNASDIAGIGGDSASIAAGFQTGAIPSSGGFPGRLQPANRRAVFDRNIIRWFVPESGVVEMYINPQNISYQYKKHITNQRTKGGYLLQYWGEDLTTLTISGTTGSSGIEGINVLHDIYRSEQISFDPYALALASNRDAELNDQFSFLGDFPDDSLGSLLGSAGESFIDLVSNAVETGSTIATRTQPTLADLAFSLEMYYSGWVFRGYFTDFRIDEAAERLGLFNYTMTFMVTQQRGLRSNFFAWHRRPDGPSNTDPIVGRPYSFSSLSPEYARPTNRSEPSGVTDVGRVLNDLKEGLIETFESIF